MANETNLKVVESGGSGSQKANASKNKTKDSRTRPSKVLPTARISTGKQLDVLRGYAAASGPGNRAVTAEEVADIVKIAESSLPIINPFLVDIGLLQKVEQKGEAWKYLPSQDVVNFGKAYEWNRDTAAQKLAPTISSSWFAVALLGKLSFAPIEESEAIATLAEKAGASPDYKDQLEVLLDYMEVSGLIQRENGSIRAIKGGGAVAVPDSESRPTPMENKESISPRLGTVSTAFVQPTVGVVNFHVDVKINMDEFASWPSDRISSFFSGIAQVLAAKGAIEKQASKDT